MAYNIKPLRQQNLFDSFGLGSFGMDDPSYEYGDEQSQSRGPTFYGSGKSDTGESDVAGLRSKHILDSGVFGVNPNDTPYTRSIADNPPSQIQPRTLAGSDEDDVKRIMDIINQTYTPAHESSDRFNRLLDSPPVREEPSVARRIVGFGVGLGNKGMGVAPSVGEQEKVLYAPYLRDMAEWTAKAAPFQQAASLENTANVNERNLAGNVASNAVTAQRNRQAAETAAARDATARQKVENDYNLGQEKNKILDDKNRILAMVAGGVAVANYKGRTVQITMKDGRMIDTGIPSSEFSATQQLQAEAEGARVRLEQEKGAQDRLTQIAPGSKSQSAKELDEAGQLELRNVRDRYPQYREFLTESNGRIQISPRPDYGWWSLDATDEAKMASWDELYKHFHPEYVPPTKQQAPNVSPTANQGLGPQQVPNAPTPRMTTPYGAAPQTTPGQAQLPPNMSGVTPAGPTLFPKGTWGEWQDQKDKQQQQQQPQITPQQQHIEDGLANGTYAIGIDEKGVEHVVPVTDKDMKHAVQDLHWHVEFRMKK